MKVLGSFLIICVVLLGLVVWQLQSTATAPGDTPTPTVVEPPATPPLTIEAQAEEIVVTEELFEVVPVDEPPIEAETAAVVDDASEIRWVDETNDEQREKTRLNELRAVLLNDPDNEAALDAALEIARQRDWPNEIRDLLARRVQLHPDDVSLRYELAVQLMRVKRWLDAYPHLSEVARARPGDAQVQYNLAITCHALARLNQARAAWDRVIELMPENPDAYSHRGETLLDLREWSAAAADFEKVLAAEPNDLGAALNLALALTKLGQPDQARELLAPLLADHPNHVPLLNRLAETAWQIHQADPAGKRDMARETLEYCERSLAQFKSQPEIEELRVTAMKACE